MRAIKPLGATAGLLRTAFVSLMVFMTCLGVIAVGSGPAAAQSAQLVDKAGAGLNAIKATLGEQNGLATVIVELAGAAKPFESAMAGDSLAAVAASISPIQSMVERFMTAHSPAVAARMAVRSYSHLPVMAMTVTSQELEALAANGSIARIHPARDYTASLDQSVPQIGMQRAPASTATGSGMMIAIVDSGVAPHASFLAGKIVKEACFSTPGTFSNATITSMCGNGASRQAISGSANTGAANATLRCNGATGCEHGTHVAGIAAGKRTSGGDVMRGVAPDATIFAIQVFRRVTWNKVGTNPCGTSGATSCLTANSVDVLDAMNYIVAERAGLPQTLAAVNLSLGGETLYQTACDGEPLKLAIDALRAAKVATVIAAGNNGSTDSVTSPACISSAITVGNITKDDKYAYSTNQSALVDVVAPGSLIRSSYFNNGYAVGTGTSMAAPTVAGAWAAIRQAVPNATADQIEAALKSTGTVLTDVGNRLDTAGLGRIRTGGGIAKPRINVDAAITALTTTTNVKAVMTTPPPGTTLPGATATFAWTTGTGVLEYALAVGTTAAGTSNIYSASFRTDRVATLTNLPTAGERVYVRLLSRFATGWVYNDYTYVAPVVPVYAKATMTAPTPGTTLPGASTTFSWTSGTNAAKYQLSIGTLGVGTSNVAQFTTTSAATRSQAVTSLPMTGAPLYVRLSSFLNNAWQHNDYLYTQGTVAPAPVKSVMTAPPPGTTLPGAAVTFTWTAGTGVLENSLSVGTIAAGSTNIYTASTGTNRIASLTNLPTAGERVYVRLSSRFATGWVYNDYTYVAPNLPVSAKAAMVSPAPGSTLPGASTTFTWSSGTGATMYQLSIGTLGAGSSNVTQVTTASAATRSQAVTSLPMTGAPLYVRLSSFLNNGWQHNDYLYTQAKTAAAPAKSVMLSPTPGTVLPGTATTFTWSAGTGVTQYWLYVGTTGVGSANLYNAASGSSLSATVSNIPSSGATIYVRLYSLIAGAWQWNDYTFTAPSPVAAGVKSVMLSPPNYARISYVTTFNWTSGTGVTRYMLSIGTAPGASNLLSADAGLNRVAVITGFQPGATYYVRVSSLISGAWQHSDSIYFGPSSAAMSDAFGAASEAPADGGLRMVVR